MRFSRRDVLLAGLGLAVTGCATRAVTGSGGGVSSAVPASQRPGALWPDGSRSAVGSGELHTTAPAYSGNTVRRPVVSAVPDTATTSTVTVGGVVARSAWTRSGLTSKSINAMNGVKRITIHHEGWTPVTFTDAKSTYARLEKIRQVHTRDRGWSDIGYHYIIDRAGRVIQGRDIKYQGAHVSEHNENNLGILVLGNFDQQKPSDAQLKALGKFVSGQMKSLRVPKSKVFTHQEFNPTECPGRFLQAQINLMRKSGAIA